MGQIYLVRHGQASFGATDYDQLSELGVEQSRMLGGWFASSGIKFSSVVTGGMKRHRQTAEACCEGLQVPSAESWITEPGFNEYDHDDVLSRTRPGFDEPGAIRKFIAKSKVPQDTFLQIFEESMQRWMGGLARDRETIGGSLEHISDLTVVVADLLRQGRPIVKSDVVKLKKLAKLLNEPQNQAQLTELLDRLPESMTDQTRTGTYGSWYNYYLCGFSGQITLPGNLGNIPGLQQVLAGLNNLNFHSTAPRCNGAGETPYAGGEQ